MIVNAVCGKPLVIGIGGEDQVTAVQFDISAWVTEYGDGSAQLLHRRARDAEATPVVVTRDGGTVTWTITAGDTAYAGVGEAQLIYIPEGKTKKSAIFKTLVDRSLTSPESVPEPMAGWVDQVTADAAAAENAKADTLRYLQETNGYMLDAQAYSLAAQRAMRDAAIAQYYAEQAAATFETDPTLSVTGKAADAKATGDTITAAVTDLTAKEEEEQGLENVVLFDETVYTPTRWDAGGINPNTGDLVPSNTTRITTNFIAVQTDRKYAIKVSGNAKIKVAFYTSASYTSYTGEVDADWTTNGIRNVVNTTGSRYYIRVLAGYLDDREIVTPSELTSSITFTRYAPKNYVERTEYESSVYTNKEVTINNTVNKYWSVETSQAVLTDTTAAFYASDPISVSEGDVFTLTAQQGNTDKTRIWCVTDNSYNIIAMCENLKGTETHTVTFTVPEDGTLLLLTKQAGLSEQNLIKHVTALNLLGEKALNGKKLSLLSDSISAYIGTIPSGNDAYYTGNNAGVSSSNQMWWKILCDKTGMEPLVIDAWSGSSICYNFATDSTHSDTNKIPMSSDLRTGRLDSGGTDPDVIIVAGGTNDWTYSAQSTTPLGSWDGKTAIDREDVIAGDSTFMETYANLISILHTNYPQAMVVCLSCFFTNRGTSNGTTRVNDMDKLVSEYNDAIERVCKIMGVPYIDVYSVGFNYENYYPTYAVDSSSVPTHPNAAGQRVIGTAVAEKLIPLIPAYLD